MTIRLKGAESREVRAALGHQTFHVCLPACLSSVHQQQAPLREPGPAQGFSVVVRPPLCFWPVFSSLSGVLELLCHGRQLLS